MQSRGRRRITERRVGWRRGCRVYIRRARFTLLSRIPESWELVASLEHLEGALQVAGVHAHRDSGFKRYSPSVYARCVLAVWVEIVYRRTGVIESFFRAVTFHRWSKVWHRSHACVFLLLSPRIRSPFNGFFETKFGFETNHFLVTKEDEFFFRCCSRWRSLMEGGESVYEIFTNEIDEWEIVYLVCKV